jgi:hypothetical protein
MESLLSDLLLLGFHASAFTALVLCLHQWYTDSRKDL